MHPVLFQPALVPPVVSAYRHLQPGFEAADTFQLVPMNLSPEEIRAIVLDVVG